MNWIEKCRPYIALMRLNKPIGSYLLLWPTLWALWIASQGVPPFKIVVIFCLGVLTMRSAGCVVNDIADRDFDGAVKRTQNRPLASGVISLPSALVLFFCLCLVGLILVLQLNFYTISLSVVALCLAAIYPFTKRFIAFPQLFLGAAYAWSIPMAFAAVANTIPTTAWFLYITAVLWPVAYDTMYALMDKEDDIKIGIKSTAILFGDWDIFVIVLLQSLMLFCLFLLGLFLQFHFIFYLSLAIALGLVGYQVQLIQKRNSENYYAAFYNNHWLGAIIFAGIFFNYLI